MICNMPKVCSGSGDEGETGLLGGARVRKDHPRVEACGAVDELNAALGLARALGVDEELDAWLERVQNDLFQLGGDLAAPLDAAPGWLVRLPDEAVTALEREIDALEAELEPLRNFILPGGTPAGAALHVARTVCRRAERGIVALAAHEPVNGAALRYINRLSDWLFVMARAVNARAGHPEIVWRSTRDEA
jgi:cob(I)alamin adenosyltransferase